MANFPDNNLQLASQQWGRAVEDKITSMELQFTKADADNASRDKSMKTSIDSVSEALFRIRTGSVSDYKIYNFGTRTSSEIQSRSPVLTFPRPAWAKSATVAVTATAIGFVQADLGDPLSVAALDASLKIFVNGTLATGPSTLFDGSDAGVTSNEPRTAPMYIYANSGELREFDTSTIILAHTESLNVDTADLQVWASFNKTLSNVIPPLSASDPWWFEVSPLDAPLTNFEVWVPSLNANGGDTTLNLIIGATVFWDPNPVA